MTDQPRINACRLGQHVDLSEPADAEAAACDQPSQHPGHVVLTTRRCPGTGEDVDQSGSVSRVDLSRRPGGGDPSSGELLDDAVEAAARAMALVDEENGCFERVDEFDAITDPLEAEDYIRAHGYPHGDREDCEYWRRRAKAAFEVIAARVRVEAVAGERAGIAADLETAGLTEAANRVARVADVGQALESRIAGAVADERQRIAEAIKAEMLAANTRYHGTTEAALGYVGGLDKALATAAGSVPVATPTAHDAGCERAYGQGSCFCQRRADVDFSHSAPGPVATPTEPAVGSWGDLAADVMGLVDRTLDGEAPVPAEQPAEPIDLLTALQRSVDRARAVDQDEASDERQRRGTASRCECPFHWPGGHGAMPWPTPAAEQPEER